MVGQLSAKKQIINEVIIQGFLNIIYKCNTYSADERMRY
jgi:hypothetical protein